MGIIQPYYYKEESGNKPYPFETMLRIHLLQNFYDLSDMGGGNRQPHLFGVFGCCITCNRQCGNTR